MSEYITKTLRAENLCTYNDNKCTVPRLRGVCTKNCKKNSQFSFLQVFSFEVG